MSAGSPNPTRLHAIRLDLINAGFVGDVISAHAEHIAQWFVISEYYLETGPSNSGYTTTGPGGRQSDHPGTNLGPAYHAVKKR